MQTPTVLYNWHKMAYSLEPHRFAGKIDMNKIKVDPLQTTAKSGLYAGVHSFDQAQSPAWPDCIYQLTKGTGVFQHNLRRHMLTQLLSTIVSLPFPTGTDEHGAHMGTAYVCKR